MALLGAGQFSRFAHETGGSQGWRLRQHWILGCSGDQRRTMFRLFEAGSATTLEDSITLNHPTRAGRWMSSPSDPQQLTESTRFLTGRRDSDGYLVRLPPAAPFSGATPQPTNTAECARRMRVDSAGASIYFRRDVMNLAALPDDPSRTADFGYFSWEDENETVPVTQAEAVAVVTACLAGHVPDAYGESDEYWCEALLDQICEPSDFRIAFMTLLGHNDQLGSASRHLRDGIHRFIHDHACELISRKRS